MFNQKKIVSRPELAIKSQIESLELRLKRLENPPKFKIGDKVKFDTKSKCCRLAGQGVVAKVNLIESHKRYYDRGYCEEPKNYYMEYSSNSYEIWTGSELVQIEEYHLL